MQPQLLLCVEADEAVYYGVLHKRLQYQFGQRTGAGGLVHRQGKLKRPGVAGLHDAQVAAGDLHLMRERDHLLPSVQHSTVKAGYLVNQFDGLLTFAGLDHPANRFQRVVQEMRLHLHLKVGQLKAVPLLALLPDTQQQLLGIVRHGVEFTGQNPQLVLRTYRHTHIISPGGHTPDTGGNLSQGPQQALHVMPAAPYG